MIWSFDPERIVIESRKSYFLVVDNPLHDLELVSLFGRAQQKSFSYLKRHFFLKTWQIFTSLISIPIRTLKLYFSVNGCLNKNLPKFSKSCPIFTLKLQFQKWRNICANIVRKWTFKNAFSGHTKVALTDQRIDINYFTEWFGVWTIIFT